MTRLLVEWLGSVPYEEGLALQRERVEARRAGAAPDALLLLEHPPVITLGRSARPENLRATPAELERRGIGLFEVARGGDVTFHGPGQLVGYPILDLDGRGRRAGGAAVRDRESALRAARPRTTPPSAPPTPTLSPPHP